MSQTVLPASGSVTWGPGNAPQGYRPAAGLPKRPAEAMPRGERLGWLVMAAVLAAVSPWVLYRMITNGGSDFPEFYEAGQHVLRHGVRQPLTILVYYWPSLDAAWAGMARLPLWSAACVWYVLSCLTWLGLLGATHRYLLADLAPAARRQTTLTAGLLFLPLAVNHFCLGAFHLAMVWLMVAGLGRISRRRTWSGGVLLGLAIWVKLLPAVALGYLALKRKYLAAAVALGCALSVHAALTVAAFGPQGAWQASRDWWGVGVGGTADRLLSNPRPVAEQRDNNQALPAVLRRVLTQLGSVPGTVRARVALADLAPATLEAIYFTLCGVLAVVLAFVFRRPARRMSPRRWSTEIALLLLATVWFSPIVWSYHLTAALPAVALLLGRTWDHGRLTRLVVVLGASAQGLFAWRLACALGAMLWATLALAAALIWTDPPRESSDVPLRA